MVRKHVIAPKRRLKVVNAPGLMILPHHLNVPFPINVNLLHQTLFLLNHFWHGKQTDVEVRDVLGLTTLFSHQDGWLDF